jgi:hypothetical protein
MGQIRTLERLNLNYERLRLEVNALDKDIAEIGSEDNAIGAEFVIDELVQTIKENGLRIGKWKMVEDPEYDNLYIYDTKELGWYKFIKSR